MGLSRSRYYDIKFHKPSDREIRHLLLEDAISGIHSRSHGTYGVLRIKAALEIEQGLIVNTKLVLKLMRKLGLQVLLGPRRGRKNLVNAATCRGGLDKMSYILLRRQRICSSESIARYQVRQNAHLNCVMVHVSSGSNEITKDLRRANAT